MDGAHQGSGRTHLVVASVDRERQNYSLSGISVAVSQNDPPYRHRAFGRRIREAHGIFRASERRWTGKHLLSIEVVVMAVKVVMAMLLGSTLASVGVKAVAGPPPPRQV